MTDLQGYKPLSIELFESLLVTMIDVCNTNKCGSCPLNYCCSFSSALSFAVLYHKPNYDEKLKGLCSFVLFIQRSCKRCPKLNRGDFCRSVKEATAAYKQDEEAQKFIKKAMLLYDLEV